MSAVNVTATLVNTATTAHSIFQIATGDEDAPTAKQVGSAILFNMLGGAAGKVVGLFGKRFADDFRRAGCSRNSFTAGTPVHTEAGLKPIEEIAIGDLVWATDPETGESALKPVTHLIRGEQEYELYIIEFATGEKITATEDHPFFVDDEWVNAQDLLVGNSVLILGEAEPTSIINIRKQVKTEKVFNLTVDGFHTFHVGEAGYLVHNTNVFCSRNIKAVFPKLEIRSLARNRNLGDLTGNEIANAFAKTGYRVDGHAITRIKDPRTRARGFNTLGDIAQIINRGEKLEVRGDVAFIYRGMKAVIIPSTMTIRTIKPIRGATN